MMLFTATVLGLMCVLNMLSGFYLFDPKPDIKFNIKKIQYLYPSTNAATYIRDSVGNNLASTSTSSSVLQFLIVDLTSLYTWNLKQLYFYIEA